MKGSELLDEIGYIDRELIEAADNKAVGKKRRFMQYAAMAACLCIALIGTISFWDKIFAKNKGYDFSSLERVYEYTFDTTYKEVDLSELPAIEISPLSVSGTGGGGSVAHSDLSMSLTYNPWDPDVVLETLPVFLNGAYDPTGAGIPKGLNSAQMGKLLAGAASKLDAIVHYCRTYSGTYLDRKNTVKDTAPAKIVAQTDKGELTVYANGLIDFKFSGRKGGTSATFARDTTYWNYPDIMHFTEMYKDFAGYTDPVIVHIPYAFALSNGTYISSNFIYEDSDDPVQKILNYNFSRLYFEPDPSEVIQDALYRLRDIPVRTLECCSGDLADLKVKSVDVEAWSPRQKKYFEVGSCSNLTDAQARRLKIRIKGENGNYLAHTLNNTVVAPPRMLIAFLENNLNADGSVSIPEALRMYMGGKDKIIPVK